MRSSNRPYQARPRLGPAEREELFQALVRAEALVQEQDAAAGLRYLDAQLKQAEAAATSDRPETEVVIRTYQYLIAWYRQQHHLDDEQ